MSIVLHLQNCTWHCILVHCTCIRTVYNVMLYVHVYTILYVYIYMYTDTGVNPGGGGMGGGGCIPPLFGWGDGLYKYPPPPQLFWRKDNLKFDIYCKEIDLFNCKTIKKKNKKKKNRSLAHKCIPRLDHCGFASTSTCILFLTSFI